MFAKLAETNKLEIFADIFDNKEKLEVFKSILTGMSREQL
jgi:hypothetical protein